MSEPHREFSPPMLDSLPQDAIGRVYALQDLNRRTEVLGTVIASWPERGPTWMVRLHDPLSPGTLTTVCLYERPSSKLGRWYVSREVPMAKAKRYESLVNARKRYDATTAFDLSNPAVFEGGMLDSDEIGPWTRWAGDLNADLMVIGQDWGDEKYFVKNRGLDAPNNPTSVALAELLESAGRPIPALPRDGISIPADVHRSCGVYLTNASLWLKQGGLSAKVEDAWFTGDNAAFLLEQIAIVQPRVVVALGERAFRAILSAYELEFPAGPFRAAVERQDGILLPGHARAQLFAVYHCGARIRNTVRSLEQQRLDWRRIANALQTEQTPAGE